MRLSTSTNILFERMDNQFISQEDAIRYCARAGYKVLDFCFHDLITFDSPLMTDGWEDYFHKIHTLAQELNIEFSQGHAIVYDFCRDDINHGYYDCLFERCVIGASILGISWLVVHPSTKRNTACLTKDSKQANVIFFKKWVAQANKYGVGLAVENMWDLTIAPQRHYCVTAEELVELVDEVEGLGICWDIEHAEIMGINQEKALTFIGERLKVTHVSDYVDGKQIHLLPYMGISDWDKILKSLIKIHYDGDLNFEIHKYLINMPFPLIDEAIRFSVSVGEYLLGRYEQLKEE